MAKRIENFYFNWLYDIVKPKGGPSFVKLCRELHVKPFRWFIPNDDNRCLDGVNLRDEFFNSITMESGIVAHPNFFLSECTVFEMLVALARRIVFQMDDELRPGKNHVSLWFFHMLKNLNIDKFDDQYGDDFAGFDDRTVLLIDNALEILVTRRYDRSGNGGLFPLKKSSRDMQRVEIWYQLMEYLEELYGR
jgi:hypothetical protein